MNLTPARRTLRPYLALALFIVVVSWAVPNWRNILDFLSILQTFVLLAFCVPIGTGIALGVFWFMKKRFKLGLRQLAGTRKRLGIALVLTFVIVFSGVVLQLTGYKLAIWIFPVEANRIEAFSGTQNVTAFLMAFFVLLDIVLTTVVLLESAQGAWSKRGIFLAGCTVFMVLFHAMLMQLEVFDSFWFESLSRLRKPMLPPSQQVTILDFVTGRPEKKEFLATLSMLTKEEPKAVVLLFPLEMIMDIDSSNVLELSRACPLDRLVVVGHNRRAYLMGGTPGEPTLYPNPLAGDQFPMSIRLVRARGSLGDDFAVAAIKVLARNEGQSEEVRVERNAVSIGKHRIPMSWNSRMPIKYYSTQLHQSETDVPPFQFLRYMKYRNEPPYLFGTSKGAVSVNLDKKRLEQTPLVQHGTAPNVYWDWDSTKTTVVRLEELRGKVLIVNVASQYTGMFSESQPWKSPAYVYATAIQNILSGDFLRRTSFGQELLLSVLILVFLWFSFGRWGAWWGLALTAGTALALAVFLLLLFANFNLFVGPACVAVPLLASLVAFFPYEILSDRRRILEERTRLETELQTAHDMQMRLMPKIDPVVRGYDISGICVPANEVGGDFFDYVWVDEKKTKLGIAVADVSGKAMRAAITAVMTSGMIYQEVENGDSPKKILRKINRPLYAKIDDRMFTALSFAVLDTKKKELRFSNAGQMYPVLKRQGKVIMLEVKGARLPLGVRSDVPYEEMVVKLKRGDTVIFYTDGIPEAKNEKDEFYGFDRFKEIVGGIEGTSAKETRDRILEDVKLFTGKSPQYDDMTVVVVKVQ